MKAKLLTAAFAVATGLIMALSSVQPSQASEGEILDGGGGGSFAECGSSECPGTGHLCCTYGASKFYKGKDY